MSAPFAGVNLDEVQVPSAPPEDTQVSEPQGEEKEAQSPSEAQLVELDKLERFRFEGRDLTPKQLKDEILMRSDYTRKTQEVAEARKYADNFEADLERVLEEPQLMAEFRKIYPAAYVKAAERAIQNQSTAPKSDDTSLPKEVREAVEWVKSHRGSLESSLQSLAEQRTQAAAETLEAHHTKLAEKYPYADPEAVDRRLQLVIEQGYKVTKDNLGKILENAYKIQHEKVAGMVKAYKSKKVEDQVTAGKQAKDSGPRGGVPGAAPRQWKSIHDGMKELDSL